jgi:hypothetical protein
MHEEKVSRMQSPVFMGSTGGYETGGGAIPSAPPMEVEGEMFVKFSTTVKDLFAAMNAEIAIQKKKHADLEASVRDIQRVLHELGSVVNETRALVEER